MDCSVQERYALPRLNETLDWCFTGRVRRIEISASFNQGSKDFKHFDVAKSRYVERLEVVSSQVWSSSSFQ
jgi:hypothetical protein